MGSPQSWTDHNPGWEYRFWTDADLLKFFQNERPDLLDLFLSYPRPVQRADLARYCILERFGGVYADVDTCCLASLEPLAEDSRVVLCEEPPSHWGHAHIRGMARLWFNGTMAGPAGHPFWKEVINLCRTMADRRAGDVLETTGPLLLSAAVEYHSNPEALALNSCGLFAATDTYGTRSDTEPYGPFGHLSLSVHLWRGSWFKRHRDSKWRRKVARLRQFHDWLFGRPRLDPRTVLAGIDKRLLAAVPKPLKDSEVLILIPVRNAEAELPRCFELLLSIDHPPERLHLCFGHGNSIDDSRVLLRKFIERCRQRFASAEVIELSRNAPPIERQGRWRPKLQRKRRAGIAKARNDLLAHALQPRHAWVLWIDADVVDYPPDVLQRLGLPGARIVAPHCVLDYGGPTFDLNTFLTISQPSRVALYRHIKDGLLQPPPEWFPRRHLHDLRYLRQVPVHGVGGTMLLVDANCHRAGLYFPEIPYRHLIETEGFGLMARDAGVTPLALPQLEIRHAKS